MNLSISVDHEYSSLGSAYSDFKAAWLESERTERPIEGGFNVTVLLVCNELPRFTLVEGWTEDEGFPTRVGWMCNVEFDIGFAISVYATTEFDMGSWWIVICCC